MLKKIEDMNHYELLEVSPRATAQEIHKAYERIRKIYDPNSIALYSLFTPEETEKIRARIEEAYRTLVYDEYRRDYDLTLRAYIEPPEPAAAPPRTPPPQSFVQREQVPPPAAPSATPLPARLHEPREVPHAPPTPAVPSAPEPVPPHISECTGAVLRALREQRKLTLQNLADVTKISSRYLDGIEHENFAKLPARPYLRGFLAQYAKALAYEPDRIVNEYMKRYEGVVNPQKK